MKLWAICIFVGWIWGRIEKNKLIKSDSLDNGDGIVEMYVVGGVVVGVGILACLLVIFSVMSGGMTQVTHTKTQLVALGDSGDMQGQFFLGSGNIGTEEYYKFYYNLPDGGNKFGKIPAENVTVYEEERKDGFLDKIQKVNSDSGQLISLVLGKDLRDIVGGVKYEIHIPKGSVNRKFNVDLN